METNHPKRNWTDNIMDFNPTQLVKFEPAVVDE